MTCTIKCDFQAGGPGSLNKRNSQQNRRGPGSQGGEQRIIPSLRQEITLHKSENAYKPLFQKETDLDAEQKETQVIHSPMRFSFLSASLISVVLFGEHIAQLLFGGSADLNLVCPFWLAFKNVSAISVFSHLAMAMK